MPSDEELDLIYQECYTLENIESQETDQLSPESTYKKLVKYIKEKVYTSAKPLKILDYGSGTGGFLFQFKSNLNTENSLFEGVEFSEDARKYANNLFGSETVYATLPAETKYAIVTMIEVVEHMKEPWEDIKAIYECLEQDGQLILTTPNLKGLNAIVMGCKWREQNKDFHLIMFEKKVIKKILLGAGFSQVTFVKYFPTHSRSVFGFIKNLILQTLNLHGGLFVIAKK